MRSLNPGTLDSRAHAFDLLVYEIPPNLCDLYFWNMNNFYLKKNTKKKKKKEKYRLAVLN